MFGTLTIPLGRAAIYGSLEVDTNAFSAEVQKHIYVYGLRQILNDAIAQKTDKDGEDLSRDEIRAKAQKRLAALLSGNLRAQSESSADPIERMVFAFAKDALIAKWRAAGDFAAPKGTKNRFLFVANALQKQAGRAEFESESEYLRAVLRAAPKSAEKWRAKAQEILAAREEDLDVEI